MDTLMFALVNVSERIANECKANSLKRGGEFTTKIKNRSMKLLIKINCSLKNTLQ